MDTLLSHPATIQIMVVVAVSSILLFLSGIIHRWDPRLRKRLHSIGHDEEDREEPRLRRFGMPDNSQIERRLPRLANHLAPASEKERLEYQVRLIRAGYNGPIALLIFALFRLLSMLIPPCLGLFLVLLGVCDLSHGIIGGSVLGGIGILFPSWWLHRKTIARQRTLRKSLPDFLDLFVVCVEGGMTLQASIGVVSEELQSPHPDLTAEFALCHKQVQFGHSLDDAMKDLGERTDLEELRSLQSFVAHSQRYGTTMSSALEGLVDTIRTQAELRSEERAEKAAVKILIPTLLFIFPAVFVVLAAPAAIRIHESMSQSHDVVADQSK